MALPGPARESGRSTSRTEQVLAVGRAFLTVTGLVAIYLDPTEPARLREATYGVLFAYALYSVLLLAYVHFLARVSRRHTLAFHGLDILWTSALTFVSEGPVSPFFLFFLFVLLASAMRWGFRETVATAGVTVLVFLAETFLATAGPWRSAWFSTIQFELNRTILRVAYLMLTGVLLGYLSQQEKELRAETMTMALAAQQPNVKLGLGGSAIAIARLLHQTFRAQAVVMVFHDTEARRAVMWRAGDPTVGAGTARVTLTPGQEGDWLFQDLAKAWFVPAGHHALPQAMPAWTTEADTWRIRRATIGLPAPIDAARAGRSLSVVNFGLHGEWRGRAYVFAASDGSSIARRLHMLEELADYVTPSMTNVFLLRRLRSRVGSAERAGVARELHDGAIQSLFGVDMKLEAIRRELPPPIPPGVDAELAAVQVLLRGEVQALRELMQALRPVEIDSADQLADVLGGLVERFRRDTGISARFVIADGPVSLRPSRALEVVRIVQEALANVRKHSRAGNVLVRLAPSEDSLLVVIEDDGCGMGFDGRLTAEELDARRLGPTIIKERARQLGAGLAVESGPDSGTRIEVLARMDAL